MRRPSKSQMRREERAKAKSASAIPSIPLPAIPAPEVLTIIYQTARRNPRFNWFKDSLFAQWKDSGVPIKLIIVDFYAHVHQELVSLCHEFTSRGVTVVHTSPMPNVWQGPHRLTSRDFFAASNSRNTGICYADDGYIVFVDDLSVLLPGWFEQVQEAVAGGWIACGAYSKVKELVVENGVVKSFAGAPDGLDDLSSIQSQVFTNSAHPSGLDSRLKHYRQALGDTDASMPCRGQWLFGASAAIPLEALLKINGFNSFHNDSLGGEDYICGLMCEHHGYSFKYCPRMFTLESEEAHGEEPPFIRVDKGVSPNDSSHSVLRAVQNGLSVAPNLYNLRDLRQKILAGEPFPIPTEPRNHWYDNQLLETM